MFSSAAPELPVSAQSGTGGTPWGPGAASAESCTHPAKRDRCFPPPIAERQRLPNVGIQSDILHNLKFTILLHGLTVQSCIAASNRVQVVHPVASDSCNNTLP